MKILSNPKQSRLPLPLPKYDDHLTVKLRTKYCTPYIDNTRWILIGYLFFENLVLHFCFASFISFNSRYEQTTQKKVNRKKERYENPKMKISPPSRSSLKKSTTRGRFELPISREFKPKSGALTIRPPGLVLFIVWWIWWLALIIFDLAQWNGWDGMLYYDTILHHDGVEIWYSEFRE